MRTDIIDYIISAPLHSYNFSRELPFLENGDPLYVRNPKTIYVDNPSKEVTPLFTTLDNLGISVETQTISVYFSNDAKNVPNNYDDLVDYLLLAKNLKPENGFNDRSVDISVDIEDDLQVTTVELQYTKIR